MSIRITYTDTGVKARIPARKPVNLTPTIGPRSETAYFDQDVVLSPQTPHLTVDKKKIHLIAGDKFRIRHSRGSHGTVWVVVPLGSVSAAGESVEVSESERFSPPPGGKSAEEEKAPEKADSGGEKPAPKKRTTPGRKSGKIQRRDS